MGSSRSAFSPVLNHFSYLTHAFRYLLDNKPAIYYLYGTTPGIHENIRARGISLVNCDFIQMILTSMKPIFGSIFLNQFFVKEWILSESIVDLVRVYTYCSVDDANDDVSKYLDTMVEERCNSQDAENLLSNLLKVHPKI